MNRLGQNDFLGFQPFAISLVNAAFVAKMRTIDVWARESAADVLRLAGAS